MPSRIKLLALSACVFTASHASGAGLGNIDVHSLLGEPFRARVPVVGTVGTEYTDNCGKAWIETVEGDLLSIPQVSVQHAGNSSFLIISTSKEVHEPLVQVRANLTCGAKITRTYQVLLDPPEALAASEKTVRQKPASSRNVPAATSAAAQPPAKAAASSGPAAPAAQSRQAGPRTVSAPPAAPRDVLRLSAADDSGIDAMLLPLQLRMSAELSLSPSANGPSEADARIIQARLAALLSGQEDAAAPKAGQEPQQMQAVAVQPQQQLENEKQAGETGQQQLRYWNLILLAALAIAVALVGWLSWLVKRGRDERQREQWQSLTGDLLDEPEEAVRPSGHNDAVADDEYFRQSVEVAGKPVDLATAEEAPERSDVHGKPVAGESVQAAQVPEQGKLPQFDFNDYAEEPHLGRGKDSSLIAEEVVDLLEVVDMWTTLGHPAKALELLEPYRNVEHPNSPVPGLGLLQIYRAMDDGDNYRIMAARLKETFNVRVPPWERREEWAAQRTLSSFPEIQQKIIALWGSEQVVPFLNSLIVDDRGGERSGFDISIFRDLLRLLQLAQVPGRLSGGQAALDQDAQTILFGQSRAGKPALSVVPMGSVEQA